MAISYWANFDDFMDELNNINWDPCFDTSDIDEMSTLWTSTFLNVARRCIPNRVITVRQGDAPWYTNYFRTQKRIKFDKVHKKVKE